MTDREKAIVMAYTGVCMLKEDEFKIFHKYVEEVIGRPVYTHELGELREKIREASKEDFLKLCKEDTGKEEHMEKWIPVKTRPLTDEEKDVCGENWSFIYDCELPDDEQEVLITTNMGSVEQVTFYRHSEYGCYFEYYEDEGDVVAWMPLPEPFKPQESEEL